MAPPTIAPTVDRRARRGAGDVMVGVAACVGLLVLLTEAFTDAYGPRQAWIFPEIEPVRGVLRPARYLLAALGPAGFVIRFWVAPRAGGDAGRCLTRLAGLLSAATLILLPIVLFLWSSTS